MKKLTESADYSGEEFKTPAEAVEEAAKADMTAGELIDDWMKTYLNRNGLSESYQPEAGTSLQTVLSKYGFEIRKVK